MFVADREISKVDSRTYLFERVLDEGGEGEVGGVGIDAGRERGEEKPAIIIFGGSVGVLSRL